MDGRRPLTTVSLAALAFGLAAGPRAANAEPASTARLVYIHGKETDECASEAELRDAVSARLGYEPFSTWALDTLFVEVERAERGKPGFVARVKLVTPQNEVRGARELTTSGTCSDLMSAMALTISLAVDPMAGMREGPPEGLPPRERPVESPTIDVRPFADPSESDRDFIDERRQTDTPSTDRLALGGGIGLLGAIGSAPGPTAGILASLEARYGWFRLAVEGRADTEAEADGSRGGRVASSLYGLSLVPCAHQQRFFVCAVGTIGELRASGIDIRAPGAASSLYATAGGRLGYEHPLSSVFVARAHFGADAVLTRYALYVDGQETFRYSALAVSAALSVAAFWR